MKYLATLLLSLCVALSVNPARATITALAQGMKPGHWRELPNTRMRDVFPPREGHPGWGDYGPKASTRSYGSAAYDTKRNVFLVFGGAAEYGGNEVYHFDLESMKWSRATEPSALTLVNSGRYAVRSGEAPIPASSYNGAVYVPSIERVFKFGGANYGSGDPYDHHAYLYAPAQRLWTRTAAAPSGVLQSAAEYDPKSGLVLVNYGNGIWSYDPKADRWQDFIGNEGQLFARAMVVVPELQRAVQFTIDGLVYYNDLVTRGSRKAITLSGDALPRSGIGAAYHAGSKRIVLWSGGRETWSFDPKTGQVRRLANPNGAAPSALTVEGTAKSTGIYGRWRYMPKYDLFIGYNDTQDNVWLYKLPPPDFKEQVAREDCGADLCVGPTYRLTRPSDAAQLAKDGQSIGIAAGKYEGDVAIWRQSNLTIRGVGGKAHIAVKGEAAEDKAIWVLKGNNTTVEHIEFSGAKVSDENGGGIRLEGAGLTVRNCYFHDNQTGILTGENLKSDVVIENSEFARSGAVYSNPHNIYIGTIRSFTLKSSYVHHARIGHNVKSRALVNYILYNRIGDEYDGNSSYLIDLPRGGVSYVIGNTLQQGRDPDNYTLLSYGAEGLKNPINELYVINNTFVNDAPEGIFVRVKEGTDKVRVINNIFSGRGKHLVGKGETDANLSLDRSEFIDAAHFDYRLKADSAAIDKGVEPGSANGVALEPVAHYVHKSRSTARRINGQIDVGAYEHYP